MIAREMLCEARSIPCAGACGHRMRRGERLWMIDRSAYCADCRSVAMARSLLEWLASAGPQLGADIARWLGGRPHGWLGRMVRAGLIRKAGDAYRFNRQYPSVDAAIAVWRQHGA